MVFTLQLGYEESIFPHDELIKKKVELVGVHLTKDSTEPNQPELTARILTS